MRCGARPCRFSAGIPSRTPDGLAKATQERFRSGTASILRMKASKALSAGLDAIRKMVPRFLTIARELGLEIVGFVFLSFALFFVFGPFGFIQAYRQLPESMTRLVVAGGGAIMFAWFGIDSFRKAKKLSRTR